MIRAEFRFKKGVPVSFKVSGHSGYAEKGNDIVCAAVSSAVELTVNGITEVVRTQCGVQVGQDSVELVLPQTSRPADWHFVSALRLHLQNLSQAYPGTIELINSEV